jgi:hypothetical protein
MTNPTAAEPAAAEPRAATHADADPARNGSISHKTAAHALPPIFSHAMDGSAIDMSSPDPTPKTTSFP